MSLTAPSGVRVPQPLPRKWPAEALSTAARSQTVIACKPAGQCRLQHDLARIILPPHEQLCGYPIQYEAEPYACEACPAPPLNLA